MPPLMNVRSINPRTGELVKEFGSSSEAEVSDTFARSSAAQKDWAGKPREERIDSVLELKDVLGSMKEDIIDTVYLEGGFPKRDIIGTFNNALAGIDHFVSIYRETNDKEFPVDPEKWLNTDVLVNIVPHGVISHIGIWNYPFWQTMISAVPALLTGNSVVFKPSEFTTMTGVRIKEAMDTACIPDDVYRLLIGGGEVGRQMVRSPCDALVFTGGVETGMDIARNAGVKPMLLELSGNDPAIVCADADIENAARGIVTGTFFHAGQVCIRVKRVYVMEAIADEFIERMLDSVDRLDVRETIGPLIREEARDDVDRRVKHAMSKGCDLLAGGHNVEGEGYFYEPTMLKVTDDSLDIIRKETFGPVCPIRVVKDVAEALRLANESSYGLGASVWTADIEKGSRLAKELQAGNVWINDCCRLLNGGELFQGWKTSGIPNAHDRLSWFLKKRTLYRHRTTEARGHWFE
jgi:acyl-CoA reductase-like NAD-dependent aldehyde dehydrogenase